MMIRQLDSADEVLPLLGISDLGLKGGFGVLSPNP